MVDLEAAKLRLTGIDRRDPAMVDGGHYQPGMFNIAERVAGSDWPATALTMIGLQRLSHLQECVEDVIQAGIPGDLIETGVWRGGACILMRLILEARQALDRVVWVADSFQGMPVGDPEDVNQWNHPELAVSLAEVQENFRAWGVLDEHVRFIPGWFKDTLPGPVGCLAVLRLDGDYYTSTRDVIRALYPKLSPGGYLIIDDWGFGECQQAVNEYRDQHQITEPIIEMGFSAYWRREPA